MAFILKSLGAAVLLAMLAVCGALVDLAFNNGRIVFGAMGQDAIVAACRPPLLSALAQKGVDPESIVIGQTVNLKVGTSAGDVLESKMSGTLDGQRYEGTFTCTRKADGVGVTWTMSPVAEPTATASTRLL